MVLTEDMIFLAVQVRKDKKIQQSMLARGLCSVQQISRMEKGERPVDFFTLEVLMQRLGMTSDKLEILLSEEEFDAIRARDDILDDLRFGRLDSARERLLRFQVPADVNSSMREMNVKRLWGILALENGDYSAGEELLLQAAELSMGEGIAGRDERTNLNARLLGDVELENLILLAHVRLMMGRAEEAEDLLGRVLFYVRNRVTDEEQLAKFLSKAAVVFTEICRKTGNPEACVPVCKEALCLLRKHGMLRLMTPLLEYLAEYYAAAGSGEGLWEGVSVEMLLHWKTSVDEVFSFAGVSAEAVNKLYFNCCVGQYYLIGELVRTERLSQGMTQEQVIEDIYKNPETLSKVEHGRRPDSEKLGLLFNRLGIQRQRYNGRVITNDYSLLEMFNEVSILITRKETEKAMGLVGFLRNRLDMKIPQNRQIIEVFEILDGYEAGRVSREDALEKMYGLLHLTYREGSERVPFEGEALILNQIHILLWLSGRRREAIELQKQTLKRYENSSIPPRYHFRTYYLIAVNMTRYMVSNDELEEAEEWTRRSLREYLANGKGNLVHVLLGNLIGMEMDRSKDIPLCVRWSRWMYHFIDIFGQTRDKRFLVQYAEKYLSGYTDWY